MRAAWAGVALHLVLVGLTVYTLGWAAVLRCSGDTDGCEPSRANDLLLGAVIAAGVVLAIAVPARLIRKARAGALSVRAALLTPPAITVGLFVALAVFGAVLPS